MLSRVQEGFYRARRYVMETRDPDGGSEGIRYPSGYVCHTQLAPGPGVQLRLRVRVYEHTWDVPATSPRHSRVRSYAVRRPGGVGRGEDDWAVLRGPRGRWGGTRTGGKKTG